MGSAPPRSKLFEPLTIGSMKLSNRISMAPLTRYRVEDNHVPLPLVKEYYGQRAKAVPGTFLISEATVISPQAGGYRNVPGIYNQDQISEWKAVTDRVHKEGSYIYCQLWALGRVAIPEVKQEENTGDVVSSSAVPHHENAPVPRELTENEIQQYISDYATAAKNAIAAGFDGVELHAANGYLIDQFTQDTCNKRTDKWGGSIENRSRFALEVTRAVCEAVGPSKVGIRLSPWSPFQGMRMENPMPQFQHLTSALKSFNLAYLHLVESRISGNADVEATEKCDPLIDTWGTTSPILIAGGFTAESAKKAVDEQYRDLDVVIVFGRLFISNPDLVWRVREGVELRGYDREVFYKVKSEKGYADYEFAEGWREENARM